MAKILVVDDEIEIRNLIKMSLEKDNHIVYMAENTKEAKKLLDKLPDLLLLDVMMPETNGFEFCRDIRNKLDIPILFITAKTQPEDLVFGFSVGGDDYIKKPFTISELRARVNAHLRREKRQKSFKFNIGSFTFNLQSYELFCHEKVLDLTKTEYEIAELLALNHGQVFSKDMIYEKIRGYNAEGYSETVVEHIRNLRRKIKKFTDLEPVKTVWGIGYKWED